MNFIFLNHLRRYRWYILGRSKIKAQIKKLSGKEKLKIILGAGPTVIEGWVSTDIPHFDILKEEDWHFFFHDLQADNLLIEHVLEHFTKEQASQSLSFAYRYLKKGGCMRIAVPDGYHPDPGYIKFVSPPVDGHQYLWNVDSLTEMLNHTGFKIHPLEYYSANGIFTGKDFDFIHGFIKRSRMKGYRNPNISLYSSLIVDAYKIE